jgi:hypothetical protein
MLKLNLLPRQYVLRQMQRRASALIVGLFVAVVAGMGCAAVVCERGKRQVADMRVRIAESRQETATIAERIQRAGDRMDAALRSAERHASLLDRLPASCVLALVANALPEQASLTAFQIDTDRSAPKDKVGAAMATSPAEAGSQGGADRRTARRKISVSGMAATDVEVANFMAGLSRNPMIEKVELVQSHEKLAGGLAFREFLVEIEFKPGADALDLKVGAKAKSAQGGTVADSPARQGDAVASPDGSEGT